MFISLNLDVMHGSVDVERYTVGTLYKGLEPPAILLSIAERFPGADDPRWWSLAPYTFFA